MTNDQINRAIAEACGWTEISNCDCGFKISGMPPYWAAHKKHLPDYCNDLNAMHEAEKTLTDDQFKWYTHWVEKLMPETKYRCYLCATASQRAEAFVRSIGKWEATVKDCLMVGKEVQA